MFGLLRNVHRLGGAGLHAVGHFEGVDAGGDLGVADLVEAAALALNAGVDIDMMSFAFEKGLPTALERGLVEEAAINRAVERVLALKARLGLLDDSAGTAP